MILAGDIGGTKTCLAKIDWENERPVILEQRLYPSQSFSSFEPLIEAFLHDTRWKPDAVCIGVAGPVVEGRCATTNLPWVLEEKTLREHLGVEEVTLINDLEATAHGIATLTADEVYVIQAGTELPGNRALIAAGTGLGESILFFDGKGHIPFPSEGGHTDFGPRNEWELELWRYLQARFGHVSYERILSGAGFSHIYDFRCSKGATPAKELSAALNAASDRSPIISSAGISGTCALCREVVDRFCEMYGAEAGNLALKGFAVGGVYIGGGIAPQIAPRLVQGAFLNGFLDKGRFRPLLERIPVKLILNPKTALRGAASFAYKKAQTARKA